MSHEVHEVFCRMDSREYPLPMRERLYASRLSGWRLVSRVSNPASSLMESPSATLWAISPWMAKTSPSFLSNVLVQRLASVRLWTSFDDHTKLTGGLRTLPVTMAST